MDKESIIASAEFFARLLAVQAGLLALIQAMPRNSDLPGLVRHETERVLAELIPRALPDSALEAFQNQVQTIQKAADIFHASRS